MSDNSEYDDMEYNNTAVDPTQQILHHLVDKTNGCSSKRK
jgi:hypothetical protein